MAAAALAARVVEVIADLGASAYRYGSGCIVQGRTVLTAAHVVVGAVSVVVRDPAKREYAATADPRFVGDVDGPGPDLAMLEIADPAFNADLPPIGLAAVDRDSATGEPVERCHAVGYPWFAETRSRTRTAVRDTVDAIGVVPVGSNLAAGLLSVQVTIAPRALPPRETTLGMSEWSGMSGAPVFAGGCLLGVVTEHAPREGLSAITAVPLTALQADPAHEEWGPGVADPAAWWSRLGVEDAGDLRRLPVPPPPRPEPEYLATVREFGRTLHQRMPQLLSRERELAEIAAFATGAEGYRWLVGGAFAGKSALLYEAVTAGLPDEADVVCYFMSRRASDASSDKFLAAVVPQLAYLCEKDPPVANRDQYYALWQQAADRAAQSGRHLLLVVDGLDEDLLPPGSPSVASLLPLLAGAHAHVLAASRPHPGLPDDVPGGHPLRNAPTNLEPFEGAPKLAELATKELGELTKGNDADLAVDILGLLTAAAGGLSIRDLAALRLDGGAAPTAADRRHVRRLVEDRAARILERVGPAGKERYQFAHGSLLEYAQTAPDPTAQDLRDPEYRQRIHRWADQWRDAGWPTPAGGDQGTPRYLLDTYPATLAHDPERLARLAGDIGWVEAAIASAGVDAILADLGRAAAANPANTAVAAIVAAVTGQAYDLRPPQPVDQPGYILRQLWMQAAELAEDDLAEEIRSRLQSLPGPSLVPQWTTRRTSRTLSGELGRHDGAVGPVAVLADGRVVTGGADGRVLIWDPAHPGTGPAELGSHDDGVRPVAVLADGRVVTGGADGRVLIWDPAHPETGPAELGQASGRVYSVAALADGRVVTSGADGVLVWDLARPGTGPARLRWDRAGPVTVVAGLPDGRVVAGDYGARVLIWDPAQPGTGPTVLGRLDGEVRVAVLPDGRVLTGGGRGDGVLIWDPARPGTGPASLGRHDGYVTVAVGLPDGRVVAGEYHGRVLIWDPARPGTGPAGLGSHDGAVTAVAVLPDGRVVTGGADGRVLIWDPARPGTGPAEPGRLPDPVYGVGQVAVLADGRVLTGRPSGVVVWDPARPGTGPAELGWDSGQVFAVAVLADGRVVTGGPSGRVLIWDPARPGTGPAELGRASSPVNAVAGLADGRVVTGDFGGSLLIWDPARPGTGPARLGGHEDGVGAVAGLADGRVVTGGADGRVLIWDTARPGTSVAELGRHDNKVNAVAGLADGRVVTSGSDRRVLIWDPATAGTPVIQLSCSLNTLATAPPGPARSDLVIAYRDGGFSLWSFTG